jgi:hypothetical protein
MSTILYGFCKFYNSIQIVEKFKSWKFTELKMLQILNSINQIAKLQSIIRIDCNSNAETFSSKEHWLLRTLVNYGNKKFKNIGPRSMR